MAYFEAEKKPALKSWIQWWDNRGDHVMEAYRPKQAPNCNLAEASHAGMAHSGGCGLNLIQSAIYDIVDT